MTSNSRPLDINENNENHPILGPGHNDYTILVSYSGIYNTLYTVGFNSVYQIYKLIIICELLAAASILVGQLDLIENDERIQWLHPNHPQVTTQSNNHQHVSSSIYLLTNSAELTHRTLNFHTGILMG